MNNFDTSIYETNPIAHFVFNSIINLHSGNVSSRQIIEDKELLFEKIPMTVKSKIIFPGADLRDGFINVYYIVLDSGKTYLFLNGNALGTPLLRGGNFMELNNLNKNNYEIIEKYLIKKAIDWSKLFQSSKSTEIIDAVNKSFNELQELMSEN